MKKLSAIFLLFFFLITSPGYSQDKPGLLATSERVQFTGINAGVEFSKVANDALWKNYNRSLVVSTGATWSYFKFTGQVGVPIRTVGGLSKQTFVRVGVELKLL